MYKNSFKSIFNKLSPLLFMSILSSTAPVLAAELDLPGYDRFTVQANHRARPIEASIWYKANTKTYKTPIGDNVIFYGKSAYMGAAIAEGKRPLVIISHGSGGNMDGLAWLSSGLAEAGAIVLAVNHQGSMTGDSSPRRTVLFEERIADVRAALDKALQDPNFTPAIDSQRISALGFSLGGTTIMQLAGANFDRQAYQAYCERLPDAQDCTFLRQGGVDFKQLPDSWESNYSEPRISQFIAVEPGFSYGMTATSLKAINKPMLLITLGNKNEQWKAADVSESGSNLINLIPKAEHAVFAPAHHFTFLPECKPKGEAILREEQDDPVCTDPTGTNRAQIHQQIITKVSQFLQLSKP
ncbi:MAG: hypothetical protein WBP46_03170 [Thiolinea sp.]